MRKFPSYTYEDVMEEKATRVFTLVEHSIRIDAEEQLDNIAAALSPHLDEKARKKLVLELQFRAKDPSEWLNQESPDGAGDKLKKIFNQE